MFALDYWRELMAALNALRAKKGMAVIMIAHTRIRKFESPDSDATTDTKSNSTTSEQPGARGVDAVLFAKHVVVTKKEDKGFGQTRVRRHWRACALRTRSLASCEESLRATRRARPILVGIQKQ